MQRASPRAAVARRPPLRQVQSGRGATAPMSIRWYGSYCLQPTEYDRREHSQGGRTGLPPEDRRTPGEASPEKTQRAGTSVASRDKHALKVRLNRPRSRARPLAAPGRYQRKVSNADTGNHPASPLRPGLIFYKGERRLAASRPGLCNSITTLGVNVTNRSGEDQALIERASRGDVRAFARLVQKHSRLVYRVALRILGDQDAQDASQEVWIRVWRNIKKFRGDSAFTTWLYKITVNTCLSERRKRQKRPMYEFGEELSYLPVLPSSEEDPEASALTVERQQELLDALKRVRAEHRAAVVLRHMEGLSYAEIGQILDVPVGTAKGWASRGRATLLVALSKEEYGGGDAEGAVE